MNVKREDLLQLMYQRSTGTGYVVNCETYELKFVNPPLLRVVGQGFDAWKEQLCYKFIYGLEKPCEFCKMQRTKVGQTARWYHESIYSGKPMLMRDFKIEVDGEELFLQTAYNVPEEMEELQLLTATMTAEQLLTRCGQTLLQEENAMEMLLEEISTFFGGTGSFLFYRGEEGSLLLRHRYVMKQSGEIEGEIPLEEGEKWVETLLSHPYLLVSQENGAIFPKTIREYCDNGDELLLTYIKMNHNFVGLLAVENPTEHGENFHLITTITGFIQNYVTIQDTVHDLETKKSGCEAVLHCVKTLVAEDDVESGIIQLLSHLTQYFEADSGFLLKNTDGNLTIERSFMEESVVDISPRLKETNLQDMDSWFEIFGEGNDIFYLTDLKNNLMSQSPSLTKVLMEDNVEQILGIRLGTGKESTHFLIMDNPRANQKNKYVLQAIIQFVESHLAKEVLQKKLSYLSYSDTLTGIYNRNFYQQYVESWEEKKISHMGIVFVDVNGLKKANDNLGHEFGDILLKWTSFFLQTQLNAVIFRLGGDEFLCLLEEITEEDFIKVQEQFHEKLGEFTEKHLSTGWLYQGNMENIQESVKKADELMYQEKQKFYQEQGEDTRSVRDVLESFKTELLKMEQELPIKTKE